MKTVNTISTQTVNVYGKKVKLDKQDIKNTCLWFADNAQGCIDEVMSGDVFVNNIDSYVEGKQQDKENYLTGNFVPWLGFWQQAVYLKTDQSVPMIS